MSPNTIRFPSLTPRYRLAWVCVWVSRFPVRVIAPDAPAPTVSTTPVVATHSTTASAMPGNRSMYGAVCRVVGCD